MKTTRKKTVLLPLVSIFLLSGFLFVHSDFYVIH